MKKPKFKPGDIIMIIMSDNILTKKFIRIIKSININHDPVYHTNSYTLKTTEYYGRLNHEYNYPIEEIDAISELIPNPNDILKEMIYK